MSHFRYRGAWGLAVVDAQSEEDVRTLGLDDPAVTSKPARFEVYAMPAAVAYDPPPQSARGRA